MEATRLRALSTFQSHDDTRQFIIDLLVEVCDESGLCISAIVAEPLGQILFSLLHSEPFTLDVNAFPKVHVTLRTASTEREWLRHCNKVLQSEDHYLAAWRCKAKI